MTHPFSRMFEAALKKSSLQDNRVLEVAEDLKKKGYSIQEIYEVLQKLQRELVMDSDLQIVTEAVEEFSRYIDS